MIVVILSKPAASASGMHAEVAPSAIIACTSGRFTTSSVNCSSPALRSSSRIAMQNSMLNLACSSFFGRWWMSALGMLWLVPTATRFTLLGLDVVLANQTRASPPCPDA